MFELGTKREKERERETESEIKPVKGGSRGVPFPYICICGTVSFVLLPGYEGLRTLVA